MSKKPIPEILRWQGFLGHRFAVIERDSKDTLYGGWRCCVNASTLEHALIDFEPGQFIYEKKGRTWTNVTPAPVCADPCA